MGRNKELKKQRQYARRAMTQALNKFKEDFKTSDYVKPCPKLVPEFMWNFLIWLVIKQY